VLLGAGETTVSSCWTSRPMASQGHGESGRALCIE
jgi:hypothetical protein